MSVTREMAVGNTFGATALSSYGGFWISFAIVLIPAPVNIETQLASKSEAAFLNSFGLFLMGWFIFTFILLLCTLRSTVAFFFLFFTLDMAFMLLGIGYLQNDGKAPQESCIVAGGAFGLMAAFAAWYNALAGIADSSNRYVFTISFLSSLRRTCVLMIVYSFFVIPVAHFPWSDKGRERREKVDNSSARLDAEHTA